VQKLTINLIVNGANLATMFLLHSPEGTRRLVSRSCIKYLVFYLFTLARGRQMTRQVSLSRIGSKSQIFPTPLSFSALDRGDPFQIYGKALTILKLESSRQMTVKIW